MFPSDEEIDTLLESDLSQIMTDTNNGDYIKSILRIVYKTGFVCGQQEAVKTVLKRLQTPADREQIRDAKSIPNT